MGEFSDRTNGERILYAVLNYENRREGVAAVLLQSEDFDITAAGAVLSRGRFQYNDGGRNKDGQSQGNGGGYFGGSRD